MMYQCTLFQQEVIKNLHGFGICLWNDFHFKFVVFYRLLLNDLFGYHKSLWICCNLGLKNVWDVEVFAPLMSYKFMSVIAKGMTGNMYLLIYYIKMILQKVQTLFLVVWICFVLVL